MRLAAIGVALCVTVSATAQVQITVRSDGTKVISNIGSAGRRTSDYVWLSKQRNRRSKYDPIIERHSDHFGVDPTLVRAVIQVESGFDPKCISRRGARGLMQLMPETAKHYGVRSIFDPEENIRAGVHYLADLIRMFPHDLPRALAAYNAGENAVFKYAGIPPYDETMTYVKRALTVYYGQPYGQAVWFPGSKGGRKLAGGFGAKLLDPIAALPGMRYLGNH
ncbi:MAG TPA: lytic transglycosylase domain-containing protein [Thermoanaerobaculia bacterium]|nr:lytic transglycosylase domain-containing protein [Thermoanaerobaculia bacterium]